METRQLGDIVIHRILELEAPFMRPLEFFDEALPEVVEPHRHWLEPNALDPETGKMILPVQSYLLRTRLHTILIDTCIGCRKTYDGVPEWKDRRDETWLHNLAIAGVRPGDIDYVFCTHLHVDHCGWNTRLTDGRWTPTFPNAKYILAADEYAACEADGTAVFRENVLPVMEAGQAVLVDNDYALDDEIWLTPSPGHTAGHVSVNIASRGRNAVMTGVILGPMADENLRRALMVSQGSFMPVFTRPVALVLFLIIVWTVLSQFPLFKNYKNKIVAKIFPRRAAKAALVSKGGSNKSEEK